MIYAERIAELDALVEKLKREKAELESSLADVKESSTSILRSIESKRGRRR